jgi:hypothetical protein
MVGGIMPLRNEGKEQTNNAETINTNAISIEEQGSNRRPSCLVTIRQPATRETRVLLSSGLGGSRLLLVVFASLGILGSLLRDAILLGRLRRSLQLLLQIFVLLESFG